MTEKQYKISVAAITHAAAAFLAYIIGVYVGGLPL